MPTRRGFLRWTGAGLAAASAGCVDTPAGTGRADAFDPLGDTGLDEEPVSQFRVDLRNRGYVDAAVPDAVEVDWSLPVNRGEHTAAKSTPVAAGDGDVVVAADTGVLRRVSPAGEVRWEETVSDATRGMHGTPVVANGTAYVGAYDGVLYAHDLETGEREWRADLGGAIGSSPKYHRGVCYIAVEHPQPSGSVAAVDAASGTVRWTDDWPTDHPHSTVALALEAGRLVVGANDGVCYAWSFPDLEREWRFETGDAIKGPVAVHDGLAVFGSWDDSVYAVHLEDGTEAWSFETGANVMSGPAVGPDGTVYVGGHDRYLYALDAADGDDLWRFETGGWIIGSITATREHVLAGSYDDTLYAVDAESGRGAWRTTGRGNATSAVHVTDDALYYAERATDGDAGHAYRLVGE